MLDGNPALRKGIEDCGVGDDAFHWVGVSFKTLLLLCVLLVTFAWAFQQTTAGLPTAAELTAEAPINQETGEKEIPTVLLPENMTGYFWLSLLGGLCLGFMIIFNPRMAPLSLVYAALEGVVLGSITACLEVNFPAIGFQAGALTLGCVVAMWFLYSFRIIKVTDQFVTGVVAATGAICIAYLISLGLQFFTGQPMPYIHDAGPVGIVISIVIVIVAALNLVIDFHMISELEDDGAPKYMEWYCAFGVMVTLVWLYLEILRLLAKIRSND